MKNQPTIFWKRVADALKPLTKRIVKFLGGHEAPMPVRVPIERRNK